MNSLNRNLDKFKTKIKPRKLPARVGWRDGTMQDDTRPNYIRLHWPDGVEFEAFNESAPLAYGAHVDVIYETDDPDLPGLFKAVSPRQVYTWQDFGFSIIKPHRLNHQWPNSDWVPVEIRQVMPLQPSVSAFSLTVRAGWVKTLAAWEYYAGATVSLTTSKPTSGARFVLVSIDGLGALTVTDGTVQTVYTLALADLPSLPAGHTPICAVRLYAGQVSINDTGTGTSDLIDLRYTSFGADGASAVWGSITGTLANQTDLQTALNAKLNLAGGTMTGTLETLGIRQAAASKAADYTLTATDEVVVFTADATATLPAASGTGQTYRIIARDGATVIIDPDGTDTIAGEGTFTIYDGEDLILTDAAAGKWE